jgi:hypothetical protein
LDGLYGHAERIKDELVHFDKPRTLDELRDLIQKIDQGYWERRGEIAHETRVAPATEAKSNKSARAAPNNDRRQGQNSGKSNSNTNAQSSGKGKEKEKPKGNPSQGQPKKPDLAEKLGKDGKLTQQSAAKVTTCASSVARLDIECIMPVIYRGQSCEGVQREGSR